MRWPWSRQTVPSPQWIALAEDLDGAAHRGELLRYCRNDRDRARLCQKWAEDARDRWFQGQQEVMGDMILSRDRRYRGYSRDARIAIGQRKWGASITARDLAEVEQMYLRWHGMYVGAASVEDR